MSKNSKHDSPRRSGALSRREFVAGSGAAALASGLLGAPAVLRAQPEPLRIGVIHPVSGFLQFNGTQCRFGALAAVNDVNAAGGIKALGGAKLAPIPGDAQSKAEVGAAEVERMNDSGVVGIVGAYSSGISTATTQAAAKYGIPHVVDVGVSDKIVQRGLENTFRFGPGYGVITDMGVKRFVAMNDAAGKPVRTVMLVHENSTPFGTGTAGLLEKRLSEQGLEVIGKLGHPSPHRDFNNIVLKIRSAKPDVVIPSSYPNEYALLVRTMQRQKVQPKAIYSVLGGNGSSYKFLESFPQAAQYIMDCNHWFNPKSEQALALKARTEKADKYFTYEVYLAYTAVRLLADAIERAGTPDRAKIIEALASSTFTEHMMPYGATRFVNGQNSGAQPLNMQYQGDDIQVIAPDAYKTADPIFPRPA